eukprot:6823-Eustigmatos_ZCMA.PRE.1
MAPRSLAAALGVALKPTLTPSCDCVFALVFNCRPVPHACGSPWRRVRRCRAGRGVLRPDAALQ